MPSSFIDIMMLRPEVRTSVIAACNSGLSTSTTPPHFAPLLSQPKPRSPIRSLSCCSRRRLTSWSSSPNSTSRIASGVAAHEFVERRLEHRDLARQADHRAVDQLDGNRLEPHDVLRRIHRLVETAEMAGADRAAAEQRRKLQFDARGKGERAFAADQHMREVDVVLARHQRIEIVAADAALHFWKTRGDLVGLARADGKQVLGERPQRRPATSLRVAADAAEMRKRSVGQQRLDRDARCRASCRSASSGRRRNCCRPCRRWWRATRSRYRPETTGRAA